MRGINPNPKGAIALFVERFVKSYSGGYPSEEIRVILGFFQGWNTERNFDKAWYKQDGSPWIRVMQASRLT
jgi:hypothetical protein